MITHCTILIPDHRMFKNMELDIRDKIVLDLGMNNIPDIEHVNNLYVDNNEKQKCLLE